jgi:CO/xanthine dehydrogenase Mo-binding subunit
MKENISVPIQKVDHQEKMAGTANYLGDLKLPGMLFAKTFRSDRTRALIRAVHKPPLPEGYFIVDYHDIPGRNRVKIMIDDQPFFAEDRVNYIGEPVLLVVGPDKQKILEIMAQIRVDYQDMAPILTMDDAENPDLPPIFGDKNYFAEFAIAKGDPEAGFAKAKYIFEEEFNTGYQEQLYLETQGVLGVYENGQITVYGSIQCPYYVRDALMQAFGWGSERVRVVQTTLGGAFGGKEDYPSLIGGQVAAAAVKTGKPVQLIFDRAEDLEVTTKRHPSIIRLRTAVDENYRITALTADIRYNAGAYSGLSNVVLQRGMFNIAGVYHFPNLKVKGRTVATNTVPNGAFRGFGAPQAIFAIEMQMEIIAKKLGLDPLDFKMKHLVKKGDSTTTGGTFRQAVELPELIATVEQLSSYRRKTKEFASGNSKGLIKGIGMSLFLHGCGFTGSGERDFIKAQVKLSKLADGKVEILAANTDMGQGLKTTFRKIVANSLDLSVEAVIYQNPDTTRVPNSGPTVASRTIMIVGKLLEEAARELKQRWSEPGEIEVTANYRHPMDMRWDDKTLSGDAYPAYSWGVNAVEVEVDPLTFEIQIKGVWSAFDVGKAIDDRIVRGQIEGGILQGLGYGSLEKMESRQGKLQQRSVTDYIIPTAMDCVKMEHRLIDNLYDDGPFGAKGAGELTLIGGAPALAAAVSNALGVPIHKLPITPEYLMEVVKDGQTD